MDDKSIVLAYLTLAFWIGVVGAIGYMTSWAWQAFNWIWDPGWITPLVSLGFFLVIATCLVFVKIFSDSNRRKRIALILVNVVFWIGFTPLYGRYTEWTWDFNRWFSTYEMSRLFLGLMIITGELSGIFLFLVTCLVLCYFPYVNWRTNTRIRLETEKKEKEEAMRKQAAERELQLEQERRVQREKKLELLKNYETAGRYEEAAQICDQLEMLEKAGELRRMARTSYQISTSFSMGKDGAISVTCPNCGSSQVVESKSNLVTCKHCGNNYIIPKNILDMM